MAARSSRNAAVEAEPAAQQERATPLGIPGVNPAEDEADRGDANPRHQGVSDEHDEAGLVHHDALRMQHHPDRMGRAHAIEQVVPGDHRHAERENRRQRQPAQRRERDHRPAQRPDHYQHRHVIVDVELKPGTDHRHFEEHEPEPSRQQEPGELRDGSPSEREKGAGSREQEKRRRTEMGDPAREKQRHRRLREVRRAEAGHAEEVAYVIERHEDHDDAAQRVD